MCGVSTFHHTPPANCQDRESSQKLWYFVTSDMPGYHMSLQSRRMLAVSHNWGGVRLSCNKTQEVTWSLASLSFSCQATFPTSGKSAPTQQATGRQKHSLVFFQYPSPSLIFFIPVISFVAQVCKPKSICIKQFPSNPQTPFFRMYCIILCNFTHTERQDGCSQNWSILLTRMNTPGNRGNCSQGL